ncbi:MAG: sensor histidine kinase, partial [Acidimicrobiales bacterium]
GTGEVRVVRADGGAVWVSISWATAEDRPGRLIVQMVDVSEHRRRICELTRSNAELSSFAFLAAHELKAPLQSLSGFAGLLDKVHGPRLEPQAREFVGWIVDGAGRMDALVEDLLAYCAVDTSETVRTPVALDDVLADALGQLDQEVARRGAVVCADALPTVTGDPVQLGQLFQNLLGNALKFVPDGRPPRVHVSAERGADGWTVTVADNGIGVEEGAQEGVFAMFKRLHPRERFKGTGIGLSICKRIVERRGGTIWVEPDPGGGSRFRFWLPDVISPAASGTAPAG